MKRIAIFIGLKIVELSGLIFIPYGVGHLDHYLNLSSIEYGDFLSFWCGGLLRLCFLCIIVLILMLISFVCLKNWDWAKEISREKK